MGRQCENGAPKWSHEQITDMNLWCQREAAVRDGRPQRNLFGAAYFSDRGRPFQSDRGRRNGLVEDTPGRRASTGFECSSIVHDQPETPVPWDRLRGRLWFESIFRFQAPARPPEAPRAGHVLMPGQAGCRVCVHWPAEPSLSRSDLVPLSSILWLECTTRSRIASASVGSLR